MSEYQFYEFQAIDRPLTGNEMSELRSFSTRARITPSSFVNDHSWGDFNGDEDDKSAGRKPGRAKRRTVGELIEAADVYAGERQRLEDEKREKEKGCRELEAATARAKYIDGIAGKEQKLWDDIDQLIATKQPRSYDQAIKLLKDLHDLAERQKKAAAFSTRLNELRADHKRKTSFLERLGRAGL